MADHRRKFDTEYKKGVVDDLVRTQEKLGGGSPFATVARKYDLNEQLLRNWNKQYGGDRVKRVESNQFIRRTEDLSEAEREERERERERKRAYRAGNGADSGRVHRKFTADHKREVVADFFAEAAKLETGSAVTPVAHKHGIHTTMLREWIRQYGPEVRSRAVPNIKEMVDAHREAQPAPTSEGRDVAVITGAHPAEPGVKLDFVRVEAHHYDDIVAHIQNLERQLHEATERLRQRDAEQHVLKQALNIVNDARVNPG